MQIQKLSTTSENLSSILETKFTNDLLITKVLNCPYCAVVSDHRKIDAQMFNLNMGEKMLIVSWECSLCKKKHLQFHRLNLSYLTYDFLSSYPPINLLLKDNQFSEISPRFHEIYSQALLCENYNMFDLAALGLRTSLEVLCKDFAIAKLGATIDDVKDLKLADTIHKYYPDNALNNSANVIRILGNDYAHYESKYSQVDYFTLRKYFDAFLSLLEIKLNALTPIDEIHQ